NAHGHGQPVLVVDHRSVNALADLERLLAKRSIRLLDLQRLRGALERSQLAIVEILAVLHRELEEIHRVDGVDRTTPTGVAIETDDGDGETDLRRAVQIVVGADEVNFHVAIERVAPCQVWIDEEHRMAAGRVRWTNCPSVGTG